VNTAQSHTSPLVVAVTGSIGSGKSTVTTMLAAHGFPVLYADSLAREVVAKGSEGLAAVVAAFGPQVLDQDGTLNRKHLAALVFSDPALRRTLEQIVHPRVRAMLLSELARLATCQPPPQVIIYEVPLLFESSLPRPEIHKVVVVTAPRELLVQRVMTRDGCDRAHAEARLDRADYVLQNDGSRDELAAQVTTLAQTLRDAAR
jgi:dephospho-CoA kinase